MNPTVFAMRRPVTTLMLVVALISGGALAYNRMRVDIFPSLNTPKIYVFLDYIGMSPDQMEGFIVINVDPHKLLDYNLTPQQVIEALAKGNTIMPAGNIYVKDSMPLVANNATVVDIQNLGNIPLKTGLNVYLRDVATIKDDTD